MGDMDYGRVYDSQNGTLQSQNPYRSTASETEENLQSNSHPWGIFFTILGNIQGVFFNASFSISIITQVLYY